MATLQGSNPASPSDAESDHSDAFRQGYESARDRASEEQRHRRENILHACICGIRIHVKDGESPGAVALRVVELAEKILLRAEERGLIAPPAAHYSGEQFKQHEGDEQPIAKPE